ncbi:MAG: restriction endonuclease subunit R [Saprospiraceae bacterium]|nr:MAG: restriction endonuclease subunit R [Saprospiraceae bacterium]
MVLQPEELVRQLVVQYLLSEKGFNQNRIALERGLTVNGLAKRCDILIYNQAMNPFLLVECKAPSVKITQEVFRQIAIYNLPLNVPFLLVTNGVDTYCCEMDYDQRTFKFLAAIPDYPSSF